MDLSVAVLLLLRSMLKGIDYCLFMGFAMQTGLPTLEIFKKNGHNRIAQLSSVGQRTCELNVGINTQTHHKWNSSAGGQEDHDAGTRQGTF